MTTKKDEAKGFRWRQQIEVEHFGEVAAGTTVEVFDHPRSQLILRPHWVNDFKEVGTVTVSGDSHIEDGIMDGDVLVVKRTFEASEIKNGKLVIAVLPTGRSVIKRIYFDRKRQKVILRSGNPKFKDMEFDHDQIRVDGIVKGLGWRDLS